MLVAERHWEQLRLVVPASGPAEGPALVRARRDGGALGGSQRESARSDPSSDWK